MAKIAPTATRSARGWLLPSRHEEPQPVSVGWYQRHPGSGLRRRPTSTAFKPRPRPAAGERLPGGRAARPSCRAATPKSLKGGGFLATATGCSVVRALYILIHCARSGRLRATGLSCLLSTRLRVCYSSRRRAVTGHEGPAGSLLTRVCGMLCVLKTPGRVGYVLRGSTRWPAPPYTDAYRKADGRSRGDTRHGRRPPGW